MTFATCGSRLLRAAGVSDEDVSKAAGHASPQVTMSMYAHALTGSARRVADTVNRLFPLHPDDSTDDTALRSTLLALQVRRVSIGKLRPGLQCCGSTPLHICRRTRFAVAGARANNDVPHRTPRTSGNHAAAPREKQHTPPHPLAIVVGPELPGTNSVIKPVGPSLPSPLPWPSWRAESALSASSRTWSEPPRRETSASPPDSGSPSYPAR